MSRLVDVPPPRSAPSPLPEAGVPAEELVPVLLDALGALGVYRVGEASRPVALDGLSLPALRLLDQTLGDGAVRIEVVGRARYQVRETGLAGVWRVASRDGDGRLLADELEVGDVPAVVRAADLLGTDPDLDAGGLPDDAEQVGPLLVELRRAQRTLQPGDAPHVVNLTLSGLGDSELACLAERLSAGPVEAVARRFPACRVQLTGRRHIWAIDYEDTFGRATLETLEVGDVPACLVATPEELDRSAARLAALLGVKA